MTDASTTNFPSLKPAFVMKIPLDPLLSTGPTPRYPSGLTLANGPSGTLESHPSYPVKIKATSLNTVDLIKPDPSGKVLRLDVRAFFKDQERGDNGGVIGVFYTGHIKVTEQFGKIMQGDGEAVAQGTDFGHVQTHVTFSAGGDLGELESNLFVGSGHFLMEDGKLVVEYLISQVVV